LTRLTQLATILFLVIAGNMRAQAQNDPPGKATLDAAGDATHAAGPQAIRWSEAIAAQRIEPGMPAELAIRLLGRKPDSELSIGAACGMLEVLTWDGGRTRIITSDGVVSSVAENE
jgi:hypothetical protein